MIRFLARRLLFALVLVLVVSSASLVLARLAPGDVTAWPGLGRLMYEALRARDIYLVAGCAAMGGLFLAFGSLVGDLLLAAVDPSVGDRLGETLGERDAR